MKIGNQFFDFEKNAYIMGILNVTPDSFSDGGRYHSVDKAVRHALQMVSEGADIIDIGGESTRPNHTSVSAAEECQRVVPVIEKLVQQTDIPLSIDTSKSLVAKEALAAGATMVNDVWGLKKDPGMAKTIQTYQVPCCLMHNRTGPTYDDFINDVLADLEQSLAIAASAGIPTDQIIIDPGIGFAKSLDQNLSLMNHLEQLQKFNLPLLLGTSNKSMIGLTLNLDIANRLEGTLATTVIGYLKGARIFRVHQVQENKRALSMTQAITTAQKKD